ncbi:BrnA antitoxin family protein [Methylophilus sp. 5]|uniref:BrnA antitoxin family protein n=1 Tax=Methylophilus sp. 5 TaxID=1112274 RepID=UPI0004B97DC0|nr:BrnA antitoxin family protein [Methylophilus sp. 5]
MKKPSIHSDLQQVAAHVMQANEYEDAPELSADFFKQADVFNGEQLVRRGRPAGSSKVSTTIRFDKEVLLAFKQTGDGWQTRMNNALKDWLKHHSL